MPRRRRRILTAVAAEPGRDQHHPCQVGLDRIHVKARADTADRWRALLKTHGQSNVDVVDNKLPPGATTGCTPIPAPA